MKEDGLSKGMSERSSHCFVRQSWGIIGWGVPSSGRDSKIAGLLQLCYNYVR